MFSFLVIKKTNKQKELFLLLVVKGHAAGHPLPEAPLLWTKLFSRESQRVTFDCASAQPALGPMRKTPPTWFHLINRFHILSILLPRLPSGITFWLTSEVVPGRNGDKVCPQNRYWRRGWSASQMNGRGTRQLIMMVGIWATHLSCTLWIIYLRTKTVF